MKEEGKCGGAGKCKFCKKYIENVSFHSTVCKKNPNARDLGPSIKEPIKLFEGFYPEKQDSSELVTKYYVDTNDDHKIKKTKVPVSVCTIKIARFVGHYDLSFSTDLFATKEEANEQLMKDINSFIDSNKKQIEDLRKEIEYAEKQLEDNVKLRKKVKSRAK